MFSNPLWIIGLSVAIAIGNYSLFQSKFEKDFVHRYRRFQKNFEDWRNKWISDFYEELQRKTQKSSKNPDDLIKFVNEWSSKKTLIDRISHTYGDLSMLFDLMMVWLVLAIIFSYGAILYPSPILELVLKERHPLLGNFIIIYFIDLSTLCLVLGVLTVFIYMWSMHSFSSKLAKSEIGEPIEKIIPIKDER